MSFKKFILNLLNAYSNEDFIDAMIQQRNEIIKSHYDELKKTFSFLYEHFFNRLLNYSLSNSPTSFAIPYLSKHNLYFFIFININDHQFDLEGRLCSFVIDINAYRNQNDFNSAANLYCKVNLTNSKCKIIDIYSRHSRLGVASFMLRILEEIIKRYKVKKITGWLSPADINNRDLQVNFYTKNGFTINFTDNTRENGVIVKILDY